MASLFSIRRPLAALAARTARQSAYLCVSELSSPAIRAFATSTTSLPLTLRPLQAQPRSIQQQSIRRNSSKGDLTLRKWKFEDINASLPADPSAPPSPSQTPQKKLILVDVREPAELTSTGMIPSAVSVPLSTQPDALFLAADEFEARFGFPKPGATEGDIVFYCKAGVRAKSAAQFAVQAGYDPDRIGIYEGSWMDWADKGGRVQKWEGSQE